MRVILYFIDKIFAVSYSGLNVLVRIEASMNDDMNDNKLFEAPTRLGVISRLDFVEDKLESMQSIPLLNMHSNIVCLQDAMGKRKKE